jgi:hypothetical protein
VRNYSVAEWHALFAGAGLQVTGEKLLQRPLEIGPWLERAGCAGADAERVRELLGDRIVAGFMDLPTLVLKGVTR